MIELYKLNKDYLDGSRWVEEGTIVSYDTIFGYYKDSCMINGVHSFHIPGYVSKPNKDGSITFGQDSIMLNDKEYKKFIKNIELIDKQVVMPDSYAPFMYNAKDLRGFKEYDVVTVKFSDRAYHNAKYKGKIVDFYVLEAKDIYDGEYRHLSLIEYGKENKPTINLTDDDIVYMVHTQNFEHLMIHLFPANRKPYKGWENRTVEIELNNNLKREKTIDTLCGTE